MSARNFLGAVLLAVSCALCGCKYVPMLPGITTYHIDIQQGNVVTQEMVSKLKPGMTRPQVRFVMGTPPIVDPFRTDRWDYVYYLVKGGKLAEQRRLTLIFDGELLKRVEGDVVAATGPAKPETKSPEGTAADAPKTPPESNGQREPDPGKPAPQ